MNSALGGFENVAHASSDGRHHVRLAGAQPAQPRRQRLGRHDLVRPAEQPERHHDEVEQLRRDPDEVAGRHRGEHVGRRDERRRHGAARARSGTGTRRTRRAPAAAREARGTRSCPTATRTARRTAGRCSSCRSRAVSRPGRVPTRAARTGTRRSARRCGSRRPFLRNTPIGPLGNSCHTRARSSRR